MNEITKKPNLLTLNDGNDKFPVDGRELHKMLEIETRYNDWFKRMCEYGFIEGADYTTALKNEYRADGAKMPQQSAHHSLTLSMGKELCMIQRTELGRQIRKYLIEVENAWNSPELVMARAIKMADKRITVLESDVKELSEKNKLLTVKNGLLTAEALRWGERPFINAAVRRLAASFQGSNEQKFAYAWAMFKKDLLYKHGYNLNTRITEYLNRTGKLTKPKTLDLLDESELPNAVSTIVALCEERKVNIDDLVANLDPAMKPVEGVCAV